METTEKIVEAYCRYIKHLATIPNIRCGGQFEIDLLAMHPKDLTRFHIETSVSISGGFSKLTDKTFDPAAAKERVAGPLQRRTVGFFIQRKFNLPEVVAKLGNYGFVADNYQRVIVTWGWTHDAKEKAAASNVELWDFRQILHEVAENFGKNSAYYTDDTLRTLQLFARAVKQNVLRRT